MKIDLSLETLLSQPAQHGPKAVLLLKELEKYYSGQDGVLMKKTITLLEETIKITSMTVKEARNKQKLNFLSNTLKNVSKFELEKKTFLEENIVHLIFLIEDSLQLKELTIYLFSDLILVVENDEIMNYMYIKNLIAINIPDSAYLDQFYIKHAIQFCHIDHKGSTNLLLCYESEMIKNKWLEIVNEMIKENQNNTGNNSHRKNEKITQSSPSSVTFSTN